MNITQLTSAEENLMQLLWNLNSFYMRDVMEHHPEPKPHQNTVSTYLKILVEKGFLTAVREGRIFKYSTAVPMENYKKFLLKDLLDRYYTNSGKEILQLLLDENRIAKEDLIGYFDLKIEMKTVQEEPVYEIADEILSEQPKKKKKDKKDKKKGKKKK